MMYYITQHCIQSNKCKGSTQGTVWFLRLTVSQSFKPMAAQLSMKAALPLAKGLATPLYGVCNTGTLSDFELTNHTLYLSHGQHVEVNIVITWWNRLAIHWVHCDGIIKTTSYITLYVSTWCVKCVNFCRFWSIFISSVVFAVWAKYPFKQYGSLGPRLLIQITFSSSRNK